MTDPRDDLDAWLHADIDPLPPLPGTFGQIRKRARRRRARQALISAASAGAAAAVIVVAVVALPRIAPSVFHPGTHAAGSTTAASGSSTGPGNPATSGSQTFTATPVPSGEGPVPPNFAATSVTFVGTGTGWVIGQAGTPGHCATPYCTSMARTDNAGGTWHGVPAPKTGLPDGGTGVSRVRFLNTQDGWAFGPELWATHDGGQIWTRVDTFGLRVTSLETVNGEAFAVWAQCSGGDADFAGDCTRLFLFSSPAGNDAWTQVPGTQGGFGLSGEAPDSAELVLTSATGYLYTRDGTLLSGPVSGPVSEAAAWTSVNSGPLPCLPGLAQSDGRPSGGQLAASGRASLTLVCPSDPSADSVALGQYTVYASSDGGQQWRQAGAVAVNGGVASLAATPDGTLVLGTGTGIEVSGDGGATWRQAQVQASPPGGFSYVGMTFASQGVAVPADAGQHAVWFTHDAGMDWTESAITNP